ncbi:MAG: ABC transporter ATP-binding protein [Thermomicrobiales bacterium]|nr:ABC transporter ATP-binding protein [Thermomicrobiales bacterium]
MISAREIRVRLGDRLILDGVGIETHPNSMIGLIGPNGSGKSTLLRCLYGALKPGGGAVLIDGDPIASLSARDIARRVSVVPQESIAGAGITAFDMVLLGRHAQRGDFHRYTDEDHALAHDVLDRVGARHLATRRLAELSGGERQRIIIARCLAQRARVLLLDEPTNHLDVRYQHEVLALVRSLGMATIVVLHDLNLAARYCDQIVLLHDTKIVCAGPMVEVLKPEVLEPVFGLSVRCLDDERGHHLLFG